MYQVREDLCQACETCVEVCPKEAIRMEDGRAHIDQALCDECGACVEACPNGAIGIVVEPARATAAPEGFGATQPPPGTAPSQEIITVQLPPPPQVVEPEPHPVQRWLPLVGAAVAFLAREIGPKLARLATDFLEDRLARSSTSQSSADQARLQEGKAGRRHRRRQRGRR